MPSHSDASPLVWRTHARSMPSWNWWMMDIIYEPYPTIEEAFGGIFRATSHDISSQMVVESSNHSCSNELVEDEQYLFTHTALHSF